MGSPPLSQGVGYGIVIGLGFAFALGMILTTFVLKRYVVSIVCVSDYPASSSYEAPLSAYRGSFSKLWSFEKVLDDGSNCCN
ncbi:uncharacterized protein K441DRAFT_337370 [Cenococcum geophilum 1.58]|uniref:Uncharacterized protein n=1 Tax=Cenococcum geophilum 1.58 TaxID=794803 RepID=A0ACC8END9_9PEZI|nr:hypothetical protein K441DRAFT_337370 [Cenococcum geophilum 1.58]